MVPSASLGHVHWALGTPCPMCMAGALGMRSGHQCVSWVCSKETCTLLYFKVDLTEGTGAQRA